MKKVKLVTIFLIGFNLSTNAQGKTDKIIFNGSFGMGTFAAGENMGGSAFWGSLLSADWIPNEEIGLSYGLETGLMGGETQGCKVYGIPAVLRIGWHPAIFKCGKMNYFILLKTGWGFGTWGSQLERGSKPNGIVGGLNFGGIYYITRRVGMYSELGYTYYGLARSRNHPEYPLGYGSGKIYTSVGLSLKIGKQ